MKELLENFYEYHTFCGDLFVYGDTAKICKPYVDTLQTESIEEVCEYCTQHNLRIYFKPKRSIRGFLGLIPTYMLTKKYGVYSNWNDILKYIKDTHPNSH